MSDSDPTLPRRQFLTTTSALTTTIIAGCASSDSESTTTGATAAQSTQTTHQTPTDATTTDHPTTTTDETTTKAEPSFEIVAIDAPAEAEIGEQITFSITVKNTGTADGTWTDTLSYTLPDSDWKRMGEITLDVPAGEQNTWTSDPGTLPYELPLTYRLENADREFTINFVAATLAYGDSFTAPTDITATVTDVTLSKYYEYTNYEGKTAEKRAGDGKQWAFVSLRAENTGDKSAFTPLETDISIIAGTSQYDATYIQKEDGRYEGGEIEPGIVRKGWLAYSVPDTLAHGDFSVSWTGDDYHGEWTARWSKSGE